MYYVSILHAVTSILNFWSLSLEYRSVFRTYFTQQDSRIWGRNPFSFFTKW